MFGFVDIILIAIVIIFVLVGWSYGFIQSLGNLIGLILGVIVGGHLIVYLQNQFSVLNQPVVAIAIFIALAAAISWLIGWLFKLVDKLYKILSIIPFLKPINKLAGAILGFIEGALLVIAISYFSITFLPPGPLQNTIVSSPIVSWFSWAMNFAAFILPEVNLM